MNILNYIGFGVTLTGFLLYTGTLWAMIYGKRKLMVGLFASGSLLMSVGLVLSLFIPEVGDKTLVGCWILSAFVWIVFGLITFSMGGFCSDCKTRKEVVNSLDGGSKISGDDEITGFWCVWDRTRRYQDNGFHYSLVEVYEVNSMLETIRGQKHYKTRDLTKGHKTKEEVQEFYEKFRDTPVKLEEK